MATRAMGRNGDIMRRNRSGESLGRGSDVARALAVGARHESLGRGRWQSGASLGRSSGVARDSDVGDQARQRALGHDSGR